MAALHNLVESVPQISATDYHEIESIMSSIGGPRIRISNEPELRQEMKQLDEDDEEWRFLAYAEEDRGLLESSFQACSYCNAAYLKAIRHNLAIAKKACQLEIDADYGFIEEVIMATKGELSRLQSHPELFSSKDLREEFWHDVRLTCNSSVKFLIPGQEIRDHAHEMLRAAWVEIEENVRTPRRDRQRKPWEQLLHNRAPGAEADLSMFAEDGSVQIIPMAATRILVATMHEHKALIHDIESQREDSTPYGPSSGSYLRSNGLFRSPDGHLRSHQTFTDLQKPTIAGPIDIVRSGDMNDSLETLNLDFAALNQRRPPLRPRMWNFISVVVHDRPNHSVDSNQGIERVEELMNLFI